ncbi:MAG TPA: hypothetical protein VLI55_13085 [Bryobacteraceae bacterium]|nr:hypothetical protein [Bryobacteraceae bacterium]
MSINRRFAVLSLLGSALLTASGQTSQFPQDQDERKLPIPEPGDEDKKLPNGKSQKNAMAKEQHEQALKDANELISIAQQLRDELQKAGDYVVPFSSVKKTEQIEKLAKRIRGRLRS